MLSGFNKIVLIIATIVLIISLLILGYFLNVALLNDTYPPVISECPDYWDLSLNSLGQKECINVSTINSGNGMSECKTLNLTDFSISGTDKNSEICAKKTKANTCNFNWDGVTNNNNACENSYLG
tara:strand:- start:708 stop:1082 length:375 start_codon:yes stop_codon:yes gene_type:complete